MSYNRFNIQIDNPFSKRDWNILYCKYIKTSKNFGFELNVYSHSYIIEVDTVLQIGGDHQGFEIRFGLFGYSAEFHFYDGRHEEDFDE